MDKDVHPLAELTFSSNPFCFAAVPLFQGDYVEVTWRRGLVASILGNAASYFIGVIGSQIPWLRHESGGLE